MTTEQQLADAHALIREMRNALNWYVTNDDVSNMPGNEFWIAGMDSAARIIARADALLSGEARYGCHDGGDVLPECVIDNGEPWTCDYSAAGIERKEDCRHWKPIQEVHNG